MKNKSFDCVEMKHKGAAAVKRRLKGKTPKEQLEYWRKRTEELRERQRKLQRSHAANPTRST